MVADITAAPPAAEPLPAPDTEGRPKRRPAAWVAMYHSVSNCPEDPYDITVTPGRLERQFAWMAARGLRGVSVRELLDARALGLERGLVGLTFDDGYSDFVTTALPVLHRWGFTATVFVLPGLLDGENSWEQSGPRKALLDADGIRFAADAGMEIASHGLTHIDLTKAHDDELHAEVAESRYRLAHLTGEDVEGFCYPYGHLDERAVDAVRRAGYRYGCAITPGPAGSGDFALPRIHIGEADSSIRLELKRRLAWVYGRALESV
ncbi:polysaccharide deacetylase family protein [Streptomyces chartreusis]|uniref:Polysaccharide deacetylase family protein n=1 Tax=Streptomyces chartreusis TaxID=1969 RepID=A0A7H8TD62_STRCX|nr:MULTISPECIES: polysaccharide deacetylase family protein [Streptomyces]MBT1097279.1 polysaccharide deacetylase family protein [Streptomyces sp. Tu102]QEV70071.1 polysaccharide deacetylase family protein [Streptomyces chartreusis]QKZ21406.1 polysaccharide deacetylase family protein [Streptomyces chartreusis]RSN92956.1 polysaccharide deacetylase family protein [Streptomyces sp. WAC 05379]GGX46713.1 polysaccharide deacetylase [Streptomyces chartreusis]